MAVPIAYEFLEDNTTRVLSRKISLGDFITLTNLWSANSTVKMAGEFLDLSQKTIIVWFKLYRDMAANQPVIGGVGHVVRWMKR